MSSEKILFKLEYLGRKVWCRVESTEISHECLKQIGKDKFEIDYEEGPVLFYDTEGVLVDNDFLPSFFKMDEAVKTLVMHTSKSAQYNNTNLSDIMTDTLTNTPSTSTSSLTSYTIPSEDPSGDTFVISLSEPLSTDFIETPSTILMPPPSSLPTTTAASVREPTLHISGNIKPEELKQQIITKQGTTLIFDEYDRLKCLTNQTRKLLVNLVCDIIVERYGLYIPTRIKEEYAKCIIEIFPSLKDPFGIKGYEMFFNSQKHDGFLAWRLKTLSRKSPCDKKKSNTPTAKRPRIESLDEAECSNSYDITETIEELKKANPKTDIAEIMRKMADSFVQRRKRPMENVLIDFPRFIDTPGLIEQDFSLLHPNKPTLSECFGQYLEKVLDVYVTTSKQINNDLLDESEDNRERWPKSVRALLALLHMLPPTAKGKKAANNNNAASASKKLILFKKNNVPMSELVNPNQKQPYLIAEGLALGELLTYHLVVDQKVISLERISCPLEAFDTLFMCHFVFNIEYDQALQNFWTFIQVFFYQIDSPNVTPKIRELRSKLSN